MKTYNLTIKMPSTVKVRVVAKDLQDARRDAFRKFKQEVKKIDLEINQIPLK